MTTRKTEFKLQRRLGSSIIGIRSNVRQNIACLNRREKRSLVVPIEKLISGGSRAADVLLSPIFRFLQDGCHIRYGAVIRRAVTLIVRMLNEKIEILSIICHRRVARDKQPCWLVQAAFIKVALVKGIIAFVVTKFSEIRPKMTKYLWSIIAGRRLSRLEERRLLAG